MTLKDLNETKIEIAIENCEISLLVHGNSKAIAYLLGEAIAEIGQKHTKEFLSDVALSALLHEKL